MKKIKTLLSITLVILMLVLSCLCFTACSVDPYYLETWYLSSYTYGNGEIHDIGYDTVKQERLYSDDITIQYFENKTFIFREFDKEYTGTYTYKNGSQFTTVSLTFSDGSKGKGTCARYYFDGTWYEGTLQVFGKKYEFGEIWEEKYSSERDDFPYAGVGKNIVEMLQNSNTTKKWFSYYTLYKGEIELRGEDYWFVPSNLEDCDEINLSQAYKLYTYEVAEDGSVQRGANVLREGQCFINDEDYKVMLDSENFELKCGYAVWYVEDVGANS